MLFLLGMIGLVVIGLLPFVMQRVEEWVYRRPQLTVLPVEDSTAQAA